MTDLVLGIDLGAAGAVSLLDGDGHLLDVLDLPVLDDGPRARPTVSASGFASIVREWAPDRAVVEFVASRPTDSPVSAFAFGMARATVMSHARRCWACRRASSPCRYGRGLWGSVRGAGKSRRHGPRRPGGGRGTREAFARARDDGRAESALIGLAGIMRERAGR